MWCGFSCVKSVNDKGLGHVGYEDIWAVFMQISKLCISCTVESQVIGYEGDSVTLRCDESNEVPIEGETPITEYLTSWSRLPDNRTGGNETLVARHIGQRNVFIAEEYEGRGLELTIRNGRLTIPEVQVRDEGRYRCIGAHRMPHETVLVVKGMQSSKLSNMVRGIHRLTLDS